MKKDALLILSVIMLLLFVFFQNLNNIQNRNDNPYNTSSTKNRDECIRFNGSFAEAKNTAPKNMCLMKETSTYLAYIPPQVLAGTHAPLVVALSPSADAQSMVSVLEMSADKLSVIIVASKESRNGVPIDQLLPGYGEIMNDSIKTLPIDEKRIIFAGFSGGGQASHGAAYFYPQLVRGVITNCGKIKPELKDANYPHGKLAVFLASSTDSNYETVKNDSAYLVSLGWKTDWIEFGGGHTLAPPEAYLNATGWLLQQMR
jgi:hypothetical protein